ncbi:hypothetical protein [Paenibacillus campinasensis]|uniref:hypothetical protein n=1 Tax=Paenibacillus campinasensis TaxID=66347 RepID=UPI0012D8A931|nr:hypothetical protein [Paenibacillus campinasensis]
MFVKSQKELGASLGLLAGTTLGSGIGFLFGWHSVNLIVLVSTFGLLGVAIGCWLGSRRLFKEIP